MFYEKVAIFCKLWKETMYFFKFLENLNSFHIIIHINAILSVLKNIKQVHIFFLLLIFLVGKIWSQECLP